MPGHVIPPVAPEVPGWRHTYSGKIRDLYVPEQAHPRGVALPASARGHAPPRE